MVPDNMITNKISVKVAKDPTEAPNYDTFDVTILRIDTAIIIRNGTVRGNATVDLQMEDEEGNKYLVMATGAIINSIGIVAVSENKG